MFFDSWQIKYWIFQDHGLGWQIPIFTQGKHSHSRIIKINKKNILKFLKKEDSNNFRFSRD